MVQLMISDPWVKPWLDLMPHTQEAIIWTNYILTRFNDADLRRSAPAS